MSHIYTNPEMIKTSSKIIVLSNIQNDNKCVKQEARGMSLNSLLSSWVGRELYGA